MDIGAIWDLIILQPMINGIIGLSDILLDSFGLSIIALTVIIRGLMYPLTIKQLHATRAMQSLQPKIAELQKKHSKDRQKLSQEQMRLYKESGVSPAGCLGPMLIQMPIWIALYQAIIRVLVTAPENFLSLSGYLYSWPVLYEALPLNNHFLWMNMAYPDIFLALLVGGSMWMTQKMTTPISTDPKQRAQGRTMLVMMPLMFTFLSMSFPSGLALYWVISNVITVVIQYFVTGWGGLLSLKTGRPSGRDKTYKKRIAQVEQPSSEITALEADIVTTGSAKEEGVEYERTGDKRQDSGGGYKSSLRKIRHRPRGSRSRHPKRR
ncbi:MAG: YidC/Oxa1 family membrane protein insertase [Dehalococcoidales bacterium]|nr:YidC/Oxa1 family membrane protein insertase [Dehalococcoidales bacterium]